jgi:hypothetical protein
VLFLVFQQQVLYLHLKGGYLKVVWAKNEDSFQVFECLLQLVLLFVDLASSQQAQKVIWVFPQD